MFLPASLPCLKISFVEEDRNSFCLVKTLCCCDICGYHSGTAVMSRSVDGRLETDVSKGLGQFDLVDEGTTGF